jgi:hypothetical protein
MTCYNFRDTNDLKHDCTSCVNFTSYKYEYEDEMEPYEYGRCGKSISEAVGEGNICDLFTTKCNL